MPLHSTPSPKTPSPCHQQWLRHQLPVAPPNCLLSQDPYGFLTPGAVSLLGLPSPQHAWPNVVMGSSGQGLEAPCKLPSLAADTGNDSLLDRLPMVAFSFFFSFAFFMPSIFDAVLSALTNHRHGNAHGHQVSLASPRMISSLWLLSTTRVPVALYQLPEPLAETPTAAFLPFRLSLLLLGKASDVSPCVWLKRQGVREQELNAGLQRGSQRTTCKDIHKPLSLTP